MIFGSPACDLLCWLRLLCLDPALADAEPKTLRYRILHTAARNVRGQRKRKIKIQRPGPGPTSSPPPFTLSSSCPHRPDQDNTHPSPT